MSGDEKTRRRLTDFVKAEAADKGFDLCRITGPDSIPEAPPRLADFLAAG
jgi:epoxyqueuosine reductase